MQGIRLTNKKIVAIIYHHHSSITSIRESIPWQWNMTVRQQSITSRLRATMKTRRLCPVPCRRSDSPIGGLPPT